MRALKWIAFVVVVVVVARWVYIEWFNIPIGY